MVKATRSLFGDNCGSETRRTFSRSSMVNRRSWANANDAQASKLMTDTAKKRFINDLSGFRSSCLGKRAYYRTFAPDWRQLAQKARSNRVSTESGSDRVAVFAISTVAWVETRSLPLPVLTPPPSQDAPPAFAYPKPELFD